MRYLKLLALLLVLAFPATASGHALDNTNLALGNHAAFAQLPGVHGDTAPVCVLNQCIAGKRAPVCATDYYTHVLYVYPSINNVLVKTPGIRDAVQHANWRLNDGAVESGGTGADMKVLCAAGSSNVQVTAVGAMTSATTFANIKAFVQSRGYTATNQKYLIFCECNDASGGGFAGQSDYVNDSTKSSANPNNVGPKYSVAYTSGWDTTTGMIPAHEWGHAGGAIASGAPDSNGASHGTDGLDVMTQGYTGDTTTCPSRYRFDCDHDTYLDQRLEVGEWLETRWQLVTSLHRFVRLR